MIPTHMYPASLVRAHHIIQLCLSPSFMHPLHLILLPTHAVYMYHRCFHYLIACAACLLVTCMPGAHSPFFSNPLLKVPHRVTAITCRRPGAACPETSTVSSAAVVGHMPRQHPRPPLWAAQHTCLCGLAPTHRHPNWRGIWIHTHRARVARIWHCLSAAGPAAPHLLTTAGTVLPLHMHKPCRTMLTELSNGCHA
jgi:hypothetical protein